MKSTRRSGKSTRIIDRCIQELFEKGKTSLYDETRLGFQTKQLMHKFNSRMTLEHEGIKYSSILMKDDGLSYYSIEQHDL